MFFRKIKLFAQMIGFTVITFMTLYGGLTLLDGGDVVQAAMEELNVTAAPAAMAPTWQASGTPTTVPGVINYQGILRDSDGNPLPSGEYNMTFGIYDGVTGGTALWTEEQTGVSVREGRFGVTLGSTIPITVEIFTDAADRFVGVTVEGYAEMVPRLKLASVPYAYQAEYAKHGVPTGAVMFFNSTTCPDGWSVLDGARGRAVVGLQENGELQGTVGSPFTNTENRSHNHTVGPVNINTSESGAHTHPIDPPNTTSTGTGDIFHGIVTIVSAGHASIPVPGHTHNVDIASFPSETAGDHSHTVNINAQSSDATTSDVMPYIQLLVCQKD